MENSINLYQQEKILIKNCLLNNRTNSYDGSTTSLDDEDVDDDDEVDLDEFLEDDEDETRRNDSLVKYSSIPIIRTSVSSNVSNRNANKDEDDDESICSIMNSARDRTNTLAAVLLFIIFYKNKSDNL